MRKGTYDESSPGDGLSPPPSTVTVMKEVAGADQKMLVEIANKAIGPSSVHHVIKLEKLTSRPVR